MPRTATHLKATWAQPAWDDTGEAYLETLTFDLLVPKPRLLRGLGQPAMVHLARSTILHNFLSRQGYHLTVVQHNQPAKS
jgi:hypothetical protein